MKATFESFKANQANVLKVLQNLQEFLRQGDEFGLAADQAVNDKLANAIRNVLDDKLRVALLGRQNLDRGSLARAAGQVHHEHQSSGIVQRCDGL